MPPCISLLIATALLGAEPISMRAVPQQNQNPLTFETAEGGGGLLHRVTYEPQAGDIILFLTHAPARRTVASTFFGGISHVAIVVPQGDGALVLLQTPTIGSRVQMNDVGSHLQAYSGDLWVRRRTTPLTPEQQAKLTDFSQNQLGKPYDFVGWVKLPVSSPTRPFGSSLLDERQLNPRSWVCSSLVGGACVATGLLDSSTIRPRSMCPADLKRDYIVDLSQGWGEPLRLYADGAP